MSPRHFPVRSLTDAQRRHLASLLVWLGYRVRRHDQPDWIVWRAS